MSAALVVDVESSTVVIAGRRFPAVGLVCPPVEGRQEVEYDRLLGDSREPHQSPLGFDVPTSIFIPAENGVLFDVETARGGLLNVWPRSATCEVEQHNDDGLWLPTSLVLIDRCFLRWTLGRATTGAVEWRKAEPDWVAESIDRWSRFSVEPLSGPPARMVPLSEVRSLWEHSPHAVRTAS